MRRCTRRNLPHWLLDRMSSQVAILSSMTCHWAQDGFFYAFEGCNPNSGCCPGNATHVWGYPQAHARLFPDIARRMRRAAVRPHEARRHDPGAVQHVDFPAFDGMCHEITATLREHQTGADPSWLAGQWPAVKKSLDYMIRRWDPDEDGMLAGPQHAMDGDQGGTTSWLGGTYLCSLAAAVKMAASAERRGGRRPVREDTQGRPGQPGQGVVQRRVLHPGSRPNAAPGLSDRLLH